MFVSLYCRFYISKRMGDLLDPLGLDSAEPLVGENLPTTTLVTLVTLTRQDTAGTRVTHEFPFPFYEEEFYIGLAGVDEAGNKGKE